MGDLLSKIGYALASLFLIFNYGMLLMGFTQKIIAELTFCFFALNITCKENAKIRISESQ